MNDRPRNRTDESLIALRRILRATELYSRNLAQASGLTPAQLRVLQLLATSGGSATPKELAQTMGVAQATVTALVDKIVSRGMASRSHCLSGASKSLRRWPMWRGCSMRSKRARIEAEHAHSRPS